MMSGELSYRWRQTGGPAVVLTASRSQSPSFVAADDGIYEFELTVTDGAGGTGSDRVQVVVKNAVPTLEVRPGEAYAGGVTQLVGTLTDPGWLDSHTATISWGDGTADQVVAVTTGGAGWGSFTGSHVYRTPGVYRITVRLSDDDGGQVVEVVEAFEVSTPVAVWANSTGPRSFDWAGGSGEISGWLHTNGQLRFVGATKTVRGKTTYAGSLAADTTRHSFQPGPVSTSVQPFPVTAVVSQFAPDGPVAAEVGEAYHDMTSACASGVWRTVNTPLADGVYYADCAVALNGSDIGGNVTLVATGSIKIAGSRPAFAPYLDGLLLLSGAAGDRAIDISAQSSKFLGTIIARSGQVSVSGASNRFYCGLLADRVSITGTGVTVRGASCGRAPSVSGPVLVPQLTSQVRVDPGQGLPGTDLDFQVRVANDGATLAIPSLIGLENVDAAAATVSGWTYEIQTRDGAGSWSTLASRGDPELRLEVSPNVFTGVDYPSGGDRVIGTTVAPGGWATWGVQGVLDLSAEQTAELLDPALTTGIRVRVDFAVGGVQARRLFTYGADFIDQIRALSADATGVAVTVLSPDGEAVVITPADDARLSQIAVGDQVVLERPWTCPVPAPRAAAETDAGYLARLSALDGARQTTAAFATATGGVGLLVAPLTHASATETLPIVTVGLVGLSRVQAGTSSTYEVRLGNRGAAEATNLAVTARAGTEDLEVTGSPHGLASGELRTASVSYDAPAAQTGSVLIDGRATWADTAGNTYGPAGSDLAVDRTAPGRLLATLSDELAVDVDHDGYPSPGDTIGYTLTVRNTGGMPVEQVTASIPVDPHTWLVPGSGQAPDGGTITVDPAAGVVTVTLPTIASGAARTVTMQAVVASELPRSVTRVRAQGQVSAAGIDPVLSDDPAAAGSADPTVTTIVTPFPGLAALMSARLVIDADGDQGTSPGDTVEYDATVTSTGTVPVTNPGCGFRCRQGPPR